MMLALVPTVLALALHAAPASQPAPPREIGAPADGYRGIWYYNQSTRDEYRYKYSGGMATYPQQHLPLAWYVEKVNKTFFVFGATTEPDNAGKPRVLAMISYYDHATGRVPRPTMLLDRRTNDAHENPVLSVDARGHLYVFLPGHGDRRPAFIYRSVRPYEIERFELVADENFSYPQPWFLEGSGFLFLHTQYRQGRRELFWRTSRDGTSWSEPRPLAAIENGHYQVSWRQGDKLATAFNYHPKAGGLNARSNLYYLETRDGGASWQTAGGERLQLPLKEAGNPALVHDYRGEKRLVYLKDLNFDAEGRPVILVVTSNGYAPGPANDPRHWEIARWTGREWSTTRLAPADHNYDTGCLHIEGGAWRLIAPLEHNPQPYGCGGEMWLWSSRDAGANWEKKPLTRDSKYNHNYARKPVNARPDFYAIWADGHPTQATPSILYFCTREGDVYSLPRQMDGEWARPTKVAR